MAHLKNYKLNGAIGILRHNERYVTDKIHSKKNEHINSKYTHLNYQLALPRSGSLIEHIKSVCKKNSVRLNKRKDLNIMSSWIIALPENINKDEQKLFFKNIYNFLKDRYGEKYVLSAVVHMDESIPHIHFCFIPVGIDKYGCLTVSSKLVCTRIELQNFHKDLSKYLELTFGRSIQIDKNNKTIKTIKTDTVDEIIPQNEEKVFKIISKANSDIETLLYKIDALNVKFEAKKTYIQNINFIYEKNLHPINKKSLFGKETVTLPKYEYNQLISFLETAYNIKKVSEQFNKDLERLEKLKDFDLLKSKNLQLENEMNKLKIEIQQNNKTIINMIFENFEMKEQIKNIINKYPILQKEFHLNSNYNIKDNFKNNKYLK